MQVPTGVTRDTPDTSTLAAAAAMEWFGNAPEMALLTRLPTERAAKTLLSTFTGAPAKLDAAVKVAELPVPMVPPVVLVDQEVLEEATPPTENELLWPEPKLKAPVSKPVPL